MLMKGLHDAELDAILQADPKLQPIILWPDMNQRATKQHVEYVSLDELVGWYKDYFNRHGGHMA